MLTDDEIHLAIDDVPVTSKYVLDVGRAIERAVVAKLRAQLCPCPFCDAQPGTQHGRYCNSYPNVVGAAVLRELAK